MAQHEGDIGDEFQKLYKHAKLKRDSARDDDFLRNVDNLSFSLDEPINGILSYLAKKANVFFREVECEIDGVDINRVTFKNSDLFPDLRKLLKNVKMNSEIEIIYTFVQPNSEFELESIKEKFTITFSKNSYSYTYYSNEGDEVMYELEYSDLLMQEQREEFQEKIKNSVLAKIEKMIS